MRKSIGNVINREAHVKHIIIHYENGQNREHAYAFIRHTSSIVKHLCFHMTISQTMRPRNFRVRPNRFKHQGFLGASCWHHRLPRVEVYRESIGNAYLPYDFMCFDDDGRFPYEFRVLLTLMAVFLICIHKCVDDDGRFPQ